MTLKIIKFKYVSVIFAVMCFAFCPLCNLIVTAKTNTLINETFYDDTQSANWEKRAFEVNNITRDVFDPVGKGSEGLPCVYNYDKSEPGYLIYKLISSDKNGFTDFHCIWSGRVLSDIDNKAFIKISVSKDNKSWDEIYNAPLLYDYTAMNDCDFSKYVIGYKTVYFKIEMACSNASWACLRTLSVTSANTSGSLSSSSTVANTSESNSVNSNTVIIVTSIICVTLILLALIGLAIVKTIKYDIYDIKRQGGN